MAKYVCMWNDPLCSGSVEFGYPCLICGIRIGLCEQDVSEIKNRGNYWVFMEIEGSSFLCSWKCKKIYRMIPQKSNG